MSIEAARYRVAKGIKFLDKNAPGWFDRVRKQGHFRMDMFDHCVLAYAAMGVEINGERCYSAGDVCRAAYITGTAEGFYEDPKASITYDDLQAVWNEVVANPSPPRIAADYQPPFDGYAAFGLLALGRILKTQLQKAA